MNKKVFLCTLIITSVFGINNVSYGTDNSNENLKVETYKCLIKENEKDSVMPLSYSVTIPNEEIDEKFNYMFKKVKSTVNFIKTGLSADSSSYDLRKKIHLDVRNQQNTEECWAFSLLTSMESNSKLKNVTSKIFSARYMDYSTSNSFKDGENKLAFNRQVSDGGTAIMGLAYLTNGQGAVLEEDMPFENNMDKISIKDISIDSDYYVKGYNALPTIYKTIKDGKTIYSDGVGKNYTYEEVCNLRKIIKQHILDYGAITAYTSASSFKSYSSKDIVSSKSYYCDDSKMKVDHAVTIIGWDDNYSKSNFTGASKPSKDGAYLVLNSYSDNIFDKGYMWISYEDIFIENILYGITETEKIKYDNLYQHDFYGANVPVTIKLNDDEIQEGYLASVYKRNSKNPEILKEVSISTNQYASFEVYINAKNSDTNINNMRKVATTDVLNPGYNTISIKPVILTGDKFSIVIKQKAINETFFFLLEAGVDKTFYSNATSNKGDSKISIDGVNWVDLSDLGNINYNGLDINLSNADVCIKGFTTYKDVTLLYKCKEKLLDFCRLK